MTISRSKIVSLRKALQAWYRKGKRDLPWRKTKDPYSIWVSEIMLQQTRVETVIPYYNRFLRRYPTVHQLAAAPEHDVLKQWEGLGYYSRARNLHTAAHEVVQQYGGELPSTSAHLRKLKGFGAYTSAAVASIAQGEPIAAVDGNVIRVVSRLFSTSEEIPQIAQKLVDPKDPSSFNQAMMELGARICTPRNPRCPECPVRNRCNARRKRQIDRFPPKKKKTASRPLYISAVGIQCGDRVLLRRRPAKGLWGGLWEVPTLESLRPLKPKQVARQIRRDFRLHVTEPEIVGRFEQELSHRTVRATIYRAETRRSQTVRSGEWLPLSKLNEKPLSRLQQKVVATAFPGESFSGFAPSSTQRS